MSKERCFDNLIEMVKNQFFSRHVIDNVDISTAYYNNLYIYTQ